jgi:hypothetical protein
MPRRSSRRRYARLCVFSFLTHPWSPKSRSPPPKLWCCQKREKVQQQTAFLLVVPNAVFYGLRVDGLGSCFV